VTLSTIAEKGAGFKVLDNPALDTTSAYGKLLLNVVGAIAEFERELIKARCADGIRSAKARGVRFGRPAALNSCQQEEARARKAKGESLKAIAATYGVSHSTISRLGNDQGWPANARAPPGQARHARAPQAPRDQGRAHSDGRAKQARDGVAQGPSAPAGSSFAQSPLRSPPPD
jgi:DNA invertase Pin-like site-specific DNA recombinase